MLIKGWREISARTYMGGRRLINVTEISPKEYIIVLVEGLSSVILKRFKTKSSAMRFMFNYMKYHPVKIKKDPSRISILRR